MGRDGVAVQAGTWTAIGFPVIDPGQRQAFYSASNWCYQLGVFISRSSGLVFQVSVLPAFAPMRYPPPARSEAQHCCMQADMKTLWAMPIMQVCFLVFFTLDAWLHFWYNYWLLVPCIVTGTPPPVPLSLPTKMPLPT